LFEIIVCCEKCVSAARNYADIGKQELFPNVRNRVLGAVLGRSQDGACTNLFENLNVNSLMGDLSNATTFSPFFFLIGVLIG